MESEWVFVLRHLSETTLSNLEVFSLEAGFDSAGERRWLVWKGQFIALLLLSLGHEGIALHGCSLDQLQLRRILDKKREVLNQGRRLMRCPCFYCLFICTCPHSILSLQCDNIY